MAFDLNIIKIVFCFEKKKPFHFLRSQNSLFLLNFLKSAKFFTFKIHFLPPLFRQINFKQHKSITSPNYSLVPLDTLLISRVCVLDDLVPNSIAYPSRLFSDPDENKILLLSVRRGQASPLSDKAANTEGPTKCGVLFPKGHLLLKM